MNREEAINVVKCNWPEGRHQLSEALKTLIPEFQESEDERINRAIFKALSKKEARDVLRDEHIEVSDALAYLERQKEYIEDIRQYAYNKGLVDAEEKHKPLSTEETELNSIAFLEQMGYTCIPPGAEQKLAEWSEEDEKMLNSAIHLVELDERAAEYVGKVKISDVLSWLKSIHPQPHWKPSKDQMRQLKSAANLNEFGPMVTTRKQYPDLESLYNDLKKL